MKTPFHKLLISICLLVAFVCGGCHKEGLGGNASITGTVYHHSTPIPDCEVFIKFDATEFPGEGAALYNGSVKADKNGVYTFPKVYKGDYYLFGIGYDKNIMQVVRGGVHVKAKRNGTVSQDVAVTED